MNKKQYLEMRSKLMNEAQGFIDQGKVKEAEEKMKEVKDLDEKWERTATAMANFSALNKEPKPMNPFEMKDETKNGNEESTPVMKAYASEEYKNAWAKTLMNLSLNQEEQKAFQLVNETYTHTTGNTSLVIPKSVTKGIWEEAGELYPYFNDIDKTYVNGVLSMIQEDSSTEASWYDEETETEDGKEKFKEFVLNGCELSRNITVSWKLKEMAIEDFIPYIQRKMAKKMGAALGYGAMHGAGKGDGSKPEPTGVITALKSEEGTPQIVEYEGEEPTYKELTTTRSKIKSGYAGGLAVYANSTTVWTKLANILDEIGRPIFVPDPTGAAIGRILGMKVKEDDSMKDGEILMSNAKRGYTMNINKEMTMLPEEHVKLRKTDYCGYAIADGNAVTTKAHALLRKKTT